MKDRNSVQGKIIETLPNLEFKVEINGTTVRCYMSGKMKINKIGCNIGDRVEVVLPDGSAIGRVTRRL